MEAEAAVERPAYSVWDKSPSGRRRANEAAAPPDNNTAGMIKLQTAGQKSSEDDKRRIRAWNDSEEEQREDGVGENVSDGRKERR